MKYAAALTTLLGLAAAAPRSTIVQTSGLELHQRTPAERIALGSRTRHSTRRPAVGDQSNGAAIRYSDNWAGAIKHSKNITRVAGTSAVPNVTGGPSQSGGSSWVGIDGDSCQRAILQTGIDFYVDGTFDAWWEWIPDNTMYFDQPFPLKTGQRIAMEVDASSPKEGIAKLTNLDTGVTVSHTFTKDKTPSALCETDAEWIMEDFLGNLADFGTVTFTDNSASDASGNKFTPAGGDLIEIKDREGNPKTDCSINGDDVSCTYVQ
ncbi:hypothetical protein VHEMI07759 [[Torrubiella] hemipterigena]|uniref:Uncharacterized protein n=1 Tax=[Torrubiella] hemipterigena TaxID=1531966 RepID=A0A0A1TNI6_9HYPO|nr:hypothetical protein VHEMI07759 [[Torrubiella] hemipterigena]